MGVQTLFETFAQQIEDNLDDDDDEEPGLLRCSSVALDFFGVMFGMFLLILLWATLL